MTIKIIFIERIIISFTVLVVIFFLFVILAPLPKATDANCNKYSGLVSKVVRGDGPGDILIKLRDDENYYYINNNIDLELSLKTLENRLVNKNIELMTVKYSSLLDPGNSAKHIAKIVVDGAVLYSEL